MQDKQIFAFTNTTGGGIANKLTSQVTVDYGIKKKSVIALWDTGATNTCISYEVVHDLALIPTGKKTINTPSGQSQVNTYLVSITLPNNVHINDVEVCDSEIGNQGIGVLIGMDIITLGDFAVSNHNMTTTFSFRIPSQEKTDYVAKIKLQNIIGPLHGPGKKKKKKK